MRDVIRPRQIKPLTDQGRKKGPKEAAKHRVPINYGMDSRNSNGGPLALVRMRKTNKK